MAELSRRDFLKTASLGGLAAGLSLCGFGLAGCGNGKNGDGENADNKASGKSGKATDVAQGKMGDVEVTVTVEDGKITAVDIVGKNETPNIGGIAIEEMPQQIIAAQSFEVDGVAGATVTSDAIKEAGQAAYDKIV